MQRASTIAASLAILVMGLAACNSTARLSSREQRIIEQLPVAPESIQEETLPGCAQVALPRIVTLATYPSAADLIVIFGEKGRALCVSSANTVLRNLDVPIPPTTTSPADTNATAKTSGDDDPVPLRPGQRANGDDDPVPLRPGQQASGDDDPVPLRPGQGGKDDRDESQKGDDPVPLNGELPQHTHAAISSSNGNQNTLPNGPTLPQDLR